MDKFIKQLYLIVASILLAFILWISIIQEEIRHETLPIPIKIENKPGFFEDCVDYSYRNVNEEAIRTKFTFTENLRDYVKGESFYYALDIGRIPDDAYGLNEFKTYNYRMDERDIRRKDVPDSILAEIVEPRELMIELKLKSIQKKVSINHKGKVRPGYELTDIITRIGEDEYHQDDVITVPVAGKMETLGEMEYIKTIELNIDDMKAPGKIFREDTVKFDLPKDVIIPDKERSRLEVQFVVQEKEEERIIQSIPIQVSFTGNFEIEQKQKDISVTVEGPMSLLDKLNPASFNATAPSGDKAGSEIIEIKVAFASIVDAEIRDKVRIIKHDPMTVDVTLKEKVNGNE